jgi:hypothetical protein
VLLGKKPVLPHREDHPSVRVDIHGARETKLIIVPRDSGILKEHSYPGSPNASGKQGVIVGEITAIDRAMV